MADERSTLQLVTCKSIQTPNSFWEMIWREFCLDWTMEENEDLGKVRPEHVKRLARELAGRFPDRFMTDFEKNKELVDALTDISSTKFRNRVAGYIIRLMRERITREPREVNMKNAS